MITGDIAEVDGHPNWIRERSTAIGMDVSTPLWGRDRTTLLRQLRRGGFRIRISCVDTRRMSQDWVGREIDEPAIAELQSLHERTGLDVCGEAGEYHTLVTDGPMFRRAVAIRAQKKRATSTLAYLEISDMGLVDR